MVKYSQKELPLLQLTKVLLGLSGSPACSSLSQSRCLESTALVLGQFSCISTPGAILKHVTVSSGEKLEYNTKGRIDARSEILQIAIMADIGDFSKK